MTVVMRQNENLKERETFLHAIKQMKIEVYSVDLVLGIIE